MAEETPGTAQPLRQRLLSVVATGPPLASAGERWPRLAPQQGIGTLLTAFGLLADDRPGLDLDVVGGSRLGPTLRDHAWALGLQGRIRVGEPLSPGDLRAALRGAAMLVLPCTIDDSGKRDGLPAVLLAALTCGTPVVTADVLGLPELVRPGTTALLVPPDDPVALAVAVAALLDDPARAARLGAAGRRVVTSRRDLAGEPDPAQPAEPRAVPHRALMVTVRERARTAGVRWPVRTPRRS